MTPSRRQFLVLGAAAATVAACSPPASDSPATSAGGPVPDKPSKAVTLNVLDVAGNLQLTQGMIDDFVAKNGGVVERVTYQKATAPELVGKIKDTHFMWGYS